MQGHSTKSVNIDFEEIDWDKLDKILYHGTGEKYLQSIMKDGILPKSRNYVHLSGDLETSKSVGIRHGNVVILQINSELMKSKNIKLYRSENGVYLVDLVPKDCFVVLR